MSNPEPTQDTQQAGSKIENTNNYIGDVHDKALVAQGRLGAAPTDAAMQMKKPRPRDDVAEGRSIIGPQFFPAFLLWLAQ